MSLEFARGSPVSRAFKAALVGTRATAAYRVIRPKAPKVKKKKPLTIDVAYDSANAEFGGVGLMVVLGNWRVASRQ